MLPGEMPESRPHSERSFDMRDRHSKHVVSSLGQSRSHPHSSSGTPEPNQDVRNCARHSDGRFGRPSDGVPNEGNLGASDSDRAVEKDSRRQPSWFEEEERTSGGAKRASERASAGAKRASARSEKVSKRESVLEEKEHRQPSWLDETSGGPGSASGTRSEASERGFQRSKIASGGAGRASVRESLIGENEHRELSWLEDKEAASLGQKRPSERASEKAFYRVSERTPGRKSEQEIEHRKQSWLAEEEWRPEAVRRASERAFGTASEGTSRQASGRASLDGEKDHRHQGWLRLSQDDSNLQGLPEERAGSGNGLAKRFGVEGRAESDDAVEKVGDEAGDRQTVRQSDFYPKPQRRGSAGAELVQAERPADNLAGSGDQRRSVGGFEPADRFVSAEGTNVREGRRFADHRRGSEGAMREMGELSERESLTKRKSTTGGQVERPSKGGGHNSRDHSRSRSASRTSAGRLSDKVAKSASGEPLPDQLQSEKHVTEDARLLKVQESRTAQGATGASYSAAKSAKRLSENRDVAEGQSKIERSEGSIDREEVGARAFRDEVEVLRLAEGEPSWTSAEPSGFLGRGEMKRPSGSSRGASGRTTPIVGTNFDDVASERGLEETVTEKRETPETRPESCATETEKRKTRKSSFGGSTIRAFFDEDTWQNRSGPPSVRESLGGSAADRRPASHLSEVGPFRSAPASKRIGTENGSGVQRASGSRVSAACVSASRQSDNVTRGSLSKDFGTRVSRFASAGTRAERNSPAESPASLSGRNGPNGRVSSDERNSVVGKASADGQGILNGRSDLNGRNSSDGRNTSNGRTDLDGGESLDGWVHAADRRTSDKRGSLSGRADSDGRNERSGRNELNERNERNGTRAATNAEPEKRSTSEETYAAATRERPVVGRAPPGSARAGSVQTEKRPDFVRSNKDHPRSTRSLEELARKSARAQVSERGESRPRQRVEVHESQGEQWADKRVTRESERGEVRVDRGGGHQKGAHVTRNNGWEATPNDGVRSRQAPSNGRFQKERLDDRFQFEDRDLDERSSEDGRSGYDSDSCRITTGGRSAREKQPGWGSGTRGPVHTARLRNPGAEMTEKQRYEKELEALSELVKEYETNALQKHRRDLESGASRSQFLLEPDTGSTLLGTPVSELSLDLPTPPEPRKKREALGGLPGKQTGGQPAKGAGNLKKSLAQTRQAAREAIKSVRAVYCASGCATQQVREGERVWKQQLVRMRGLNSFSLLVTGVTLYEAAFTSLGP